MGVATSLPYPILLGTDVPILADLVQGTAWCGVVTRAQTQRIRQEKETNTWNEMPFSTADIEAEPKPTEEERLERRREEVKSFVGDTDHAELDLGEPELTDSDFTIPNNLAQLQREDPSLVEGFKQAEEEGCLLQGLGETYVLKAGLLYRTSKEEGSQLVVPKAYRKEVLELGHTVPWSGHLGFMKTLMQISKRFYWPKMYTVVKEYCKSCPKCQLTTSYIPAYAPLNPLPVIDMPFERIGVDVVGPLERSQSGNRFILVICDYATRYPEAYPLREVTAKQVATALLRLFTQVGIPKEVPTDQGPNFMSRTLHQVYQLLGIKRVRTTPYHPQTDGLVEGFNKTLKNMLKMFASETGKDWDKWLPYLLFAYREVPQAATGFSQF